MYQISAWGVQLIQYFEKFRANAYLDPAGIPTIGYGTIRRNGQPVKLGDTITMEEAVSLLMEEANGIAGQLDRLISVPVNQNQVDSLIDFCYNLGVGALQGSSLRKAINGNSPITEDLFTRWNKAHVNGELVELPGLTKRRKYEFLNYIAPVTDVRI